MIVVKEKSEKKLIEALGSYSDNHSGQRCIHLNTSSIEESERPKADAITGVISEFIIDNDAKFFCLEDGDIFILAKGINSSSFDKISNAIAILLSVPEPGDLIHLHSVEREWSALSVVFEDKYKKANENKKPEAKPAEIVKPEKKQVTIKTSDVQKELATTIRERKNSHETPEILVVEDDAFSRQLVNKILQKDYKVTSVENGQSAINSYFIKAPNIMFLDIDLPDIDGHAVLGKIMEIDPEAYVIMLSGNSDKTNVLKAVQQGGAKGFVGKPFNKDKLIQYIKNCPTTTNQRRSL